MAPSQHRPVLQHGISSQRQHAVLRRVLARCTHAARQIRTFQYVSIPDDLRRPSPKGKPCFPQRLSFSYTQSIM